MDVVETTGRTSQEAIEAALQQLGKTRDEVDVKVLRESTGGMLRFLGVGLAKVRVAVRGTQQAQAATATEAPRKGDRRAGPDKQDRRRDAPRKPEGGAAKAQERRGEGRGGRRRGEGPGEGGGQGGRAQRPPRAQESGPRPSAPQAESDDLEGLDIHRGADTPKQARDLIQAFLRHMEINTDVQVSEDEGGTELFVDIGKGASVLIGRKGQTLAAFEYLLGRMLGGEQDRWKKITVDVDGYRRSRDDQLIGKARTLAEQVKRDGAPVFTDPMYPRERRMFHMTIKEDDAVESKSYGSGIMRRVAIFPAGQPPQEVTQDASGDAGPADAPSPEATPDES